MNLFLGTYWEVLETAHRIVGVDLVVVEDKPTAARATESARRLGIETRVLTPGVKTLDLTPSRVGLAISGSFGRILRQPFIARCGLVLNFHPGIVETCRGRHTIPLNALRGDAEMGITVHVIDDERIDAGPVVAQIRLPIDYDADFDANHARLRRFLAPLADGVLTEYRERGDVTSRAWAVDTESYHPPLPPETLRRVFDAKRLRDVAPGLIQGG